MYIVEANRPNCYVMPCGIHMVPFGPVPRPALSSVTTGSSVTIVPVVEVGPGCPNAHNKSVPLCPMRM